MPTTADIGKAEKHQLISELGYELIRWQIMPAIKTQPEAYRFIKEQVVYSLRMVWQGRFDKFSSEHCELINRVSLAYLPEKYGYGGAKRNNTVMKDQDHTQLAIEVFDRLWEDYMADDGHGLPRPFVVEQLPPLHKRIINFFKRG